MSDSIPEQRFGPTSGVVSGVAGLLVCAAVIGLAVADGLGTISVRVVLGALAGAVLVWAFMLRPRIVIEQGGRTLLLRNAFVDRRVPLAAVKVVGVRAVTRIETEDARFDCVAVGRPLRKAVRRGAGPFGTLQGQWGSTPQSAHDVPRQITEMSTHDLMTEQVLYAADQARMHGYPDAPVERKPAVPELVLLGVFLVALAVSFFV